MKRARWIAALVTILFCLAVGAYSKQQELAKQRQQDEIAQIEKELDRATRHASQLAERLEHAKAILTQ